MKLTLSAVAAMALAMAVSYGDEPRIVGPVADGTPVPEVPKPVFEFSAQDILESTSHQQGGRNIIVQRVSPQPLPPPPIPAAEPTPEQQAALEVALADFREDHPSTDLLVLGATIYRSADSPTRTLVRWWPQGAGRQQVTFWSSADFSLISGIQSFSDSAGNIHAVLMGWGITSIEQQRKLRAEHGIEFDEPEIPDFPEGDATFVIIDETPDAETLAPIQALHDLYNKERARLQTAFDGREAARLAREAYLKAHPPQPKDITLRYWRTESPAPPKGGDQ